MRETLRISVGQMCSEPSHAANISGVEVLAAQARSQGSQLLALPEVAGLLNSKFEDADPMVVDTQADPFIAACQRIAAREALWIHTGSTPVRAPDGRFLNRSTLIDQDGEIRAHYDKLHLFDVDVAGTRAFRESKRYAPGDKAVMVETPWGGFGLTICYDLRFPYLYRALAKAGAQVIFIPSAFTVPTGKAHWEVLLRARAIETGAFIVAPAQSGHHADGRETYGHSLVVDPWGKVLLDMLEDAPQLYTLDLDLTMAARTRAQIPSLENGRDVPLEVLQQDVSRL